MNIQGLIERYEKFKASKKKLTSVDLVLKDLRSLDEPEPLPFKLKDVVRRIRGFDPTTQTRWLNDILSLWRKLSSITRDRTLHYMMRLEKKTSTNNTMSG